MKATSCAVFAGVAMLLAALPARAHHSFAAEFEVNQPIALEGTLTKLDWVNPHGWIYVDVKGPDGTVQNTPGAPPEREVAGGLKASSTSPEAAARSTT